MRIVITGSSGRLGSATVRELLASGHEVVAVDMRNSNDGAAPPTRIADLRHIEQLRPLMRGADAVCHMGSFPGFSQVAAPEGFANNVEGTFNVFQMAEECDIPRVIYASSIQAYGCFRNAPQEIIQPPAYLPIDEAHPLRPSHGYAMSKAAGEWIAESYSRRRPQASVFSLRFTQVYTRYVMRPPGRGQAAPLWGALGTFIHSHDAARAVRLCCPSPREGYLALNILAPWPTDPWSQEDIAQAYGHVPDFRETLTPEQPLISAARAREVIGFIAEMPLHDPATEAQAFQNR